MKARVFIVEDEPNIVESLRFILTRADYDVVAITDGLQAETVLEQSAPAAIILDVMLPNRSGFEILKSLKSNAALARIPVLMLTAKGQDQDRETALRLGADAFMTKPFSNKEVLACIGELLSGA